MIKAILFFLISVLVIVQTHAQDTFSICAVDTVTGEVGSAGASCIDASAIAGGVVIISDVHNGVGVIHTQSYWLSANQIYARNLMNAGLSPQQIIDSLVANDVQNNPGIRQYGVVDLFNGGARSAAYTGANCLNYKNHILGPNYAIQGNILLGQGILDSMEARFLNTPGDLACKLMAALQGAKVVGADTRCSTSGNSSLSAFLRVSCPNDPPNTYSVNIVVPQGPPGFEPIDSVQTLFNNVSTCVNPLNCAAGMSQYFGNEFTVRFDPNPVKGNGAVIRIKNRKKESYNIQIFSGGGSLIWSGPVSDGQTIDFQNFPAGIGYFQVISGSGARSGGKVLVVK